MLFFYELSLPSLQKVSQVPHSGFRNHLALLKTYTVSFMKAKDRQAYLSPPPRYKKTGLRKKERRTA